MGPGRDRMAYYVPADNAADWLAAWLDKETTFIVIGNDAAPKREWAEARPDRFLLWRREWPQWGAGR